VKKKQHHPVDGKAASYVEAATIFDKITLPKLLLAADEL